VQTIFADYARLFPERFHNVTNGVTPRRWLQQANPGLSALLDKHIGKGWRKDLDQLGKLAQAVGPKELQRAFREPSTPTRSAWRRLVRKSLGPVLTPTACSTCRSSASTSTSASCSTCCT
jgi:starch phosphorylase